MLRPPPLRTDGSNAFARYSMQVRVPRIVRETLAHNPDYPAPIRGALESLAVEIEGDGPLPVPRAPAPDVEAWTAAHRAHGSESWLRAEWFHAELAVYREIASRCRFWETGRDPFEPAKEEELAGERPWSRLETLASDGGREERLRERLDACLWGNRVDLSYTVAAGRARSDDDLLVDERDSFLASLRRDDARVHLIADNAGTELALDLAVVDGILEAPGARVAMHVKSQPVFVSDALAVDVTRTFRAMESRGGAVAAMGRRLVAAFDEGRLELLADPFWSGPRFLWEAPAHVTQALRSATAVLLKGDANYRRLSGDALWDPAEPFSAIGALFDVPLACARTLKSDSVLGLPRGLAERLDGLDASWRVDGSRGVFQTWTP